jgi:hypothetical protein
VIAGLPKVPRGKERIKIKLIGNGMVSRRT